jgi:hypothetical protein
MIAEVGRGVLGKRRFIKAMTGRAVPVRAITTRKKNSQRGPTVGRVLSTSAASPPQPVTMSRMDTGTNEVIEGEVRGSIG